MSSQLINHIYSTAEPKLFFLLQALLGSRLEFLLNTEIAIALLVRSLNSIVVFSFNQICTFASVENSRDQLCKNLRGIEEQRLQTRLLA